MTEPTALPELPEPLIRLPLALAVQWNNAVSCAEREPSKDVVLEGRTVLAIEKAIEACAREATERERERAAKVLEKLRDEHCAGTAASHDKFDHCSPKGGDGCDFVDAWNEGAEAIRKG